MVEVSVDGDIFDAQGEKTDYGWSGPSPAFLIICADIAAGGAAVHAARGRLSRVDAYGAELDEADVGTGDALTPSFISDVHVTDHGLVVWTDTDGELTQEMGQKMLDILREELHARAVTARIAAPRAGLQLGNEVWTPPIELPSRETPKATPSPRVALPAPLEVLVRFPPTGPGIHLPQLARRVEGLAAYVLLLSMPLLDSRHGFPRGTSGFSEDEFMRAFNSARGSVPYQVRVVSVSMDPADTVTLEIESGLVPADRLVQQLVSAHAAFDDLRRSLPNPIDAAVDAIKQATTGGRGLIPQNPYPIVTTTIHAAAAALTLIEGFATK